MKYENEVIVRSFEHAVESLKREYERWDVRIARDERNYSLMRMHLRQTKEIIEKAREGGMPTEYDEGLAKHYAEADERLDSLQSGIDKMRKILIKYAYGILEIEKVITDTVYAISLFDQETIEQEECEDVIEASTTKVRELLDEMKKGSEEE
tara:strand:- start:2715 stop:3170 length:456 start_codon:yes stop_codon:yes gene_type:complete